VETAVWSPINGIKNFYFNGTDSLGMLKHYSGNQVYFHTTQRRAIFTIFDK